MKPTPLPYGLWVHALENFTSVKSYVYLLFWSHSWLSTQPTTDDVPIELFMSDIAGDLMFVKISNALLNRYWT